MARAPETGEIPLFPLANVVLFPGVRAPLHVFEPRYRQMTADAIAGEHCIGMIAVRPEHAGEMEGDPPLFAIGCAGSIVESELLPDGRFNMILLGTRRFRVRNEGPRPAGRLYRIAEVEWLDEAPLRDADGARLRREVIAAFQAFAQQSAPARTPEISPALFDGVDDATLIHTLCQLLDLAPIEKQGLLEAIGVLERGERLASVLRFRAAEVAWPSGGADPTRH
jgi:Lon protease-like protein